MYSLCSCQDFLNENVLRFDVSVNQSLLVLVVDARANLKEEAEETILTKVEILQ